MAERTSWHPPVRQWGSPFNVDQEFPRGAIVFDPEAIKVAAQALDVVLYEIEKSGSEFAKHRLTPMPRAKKLPSICLKWPAAGKELHTRRRRGEISC